MPAQLTYPGVYIEELPSGVHTITGVATSIAAFFGRALRGPTDVATTINSYSDFERIFGGLWIESALGYAVRDFFLNGGSQAIIVRLYNSDLITPNAPSAKAKMNINIKDASGTSIGDINLEAAYEGKWGANLRATIDYDVSEDVALRMGLTKADLFNLTVTDIGPNGITEKFLNLSIKESPRSLCRVLENESRLVRWDDAVSYPASQTLGVISSSDDVTEAESECKEAKKKLEAAKKATPSPTDSEIAALEAAITAARSTIATKKTEMEGSDGVPLTDASNFIQDGAETNKKGLYALEQVDLFNILCIPPYNSAENVDSALISAAAAYCEKRRAMLLIDSPSEWKSKKTAKEQVDNLGTKSKNAALFFPRLKQPNPLRNNQMEDFVPCGAVAGIFARTDMQRGVWKAPAGLEASLVGVPQLSVSLTDAENGELNPLGINCLRALPPAGRVVWGARTLQGDDRLASEWKYIPVRRTALFIEESLFRGLKWAVFEPNDEPLWSQIRLNAGAFMHNLFRQGAFQGATPKEAYFVKCDRETTTQSEIDSGIVNVVVGFAPLKPAEFVVIKLQQIAGQVQT
ncbi:MAG: Phage tail sheath protein [Methanosaeta sp. PtaU1.Bin112]|nr:MAG: Phage tail sheath protein [Methanosaeta sp. PtaU1.Bin112]